MAHAILNNSTEHKELLKLEESLARWEMIVKLVAVCIICLSAWLTAKGLFDATIEAHAANTEGMVTACMTAAVAAIMIGAGTMLLFCLAMHAEKKQLKHIIALTLAIAPLVFCVSTYNAILATSAQRSMIYDMRDKTTAWKNYVEISFKEAAKSQNAKASLLPSQSSLCTLAMGEKNSGLLSGSRGTGAVYSAYASACSSVTTIIDTLTEIVERTHIRRDEAEEILNLIDNIPRNTSISIFDRQAQFKQQDNHLRKLVEAFNSERITEQVSAQLKIMEGLITTIGAQDGAFGRKQTQAVQNLKKSLGVVAGIVDKLLLSDNSASSATMPEELLSMDEATFKYMRRNMPSVMLAVATDTFSIWMLAFLLTARSMLQSRREELYIADLSLPKINTTTKPI